jgi:threonine aldolase
LTDDAGMDGDSLAGALAKKKVKIHPVGGNRIRLVTHYWIDDAAVSKVIEAFEDALGSAS